MSLFRVLSLIVLISIMPVFATEPSLKQAVKSATTTLSDIEKSKSSCTYCQLQSLPHDLNCPEQVMASYKGIHRKGTVGFINTVISDGGQKNPRTVCSTSADAVSSIKVEDFYKDLQSQYPDSRQLYDLTQKCDEGINGDKRNLAVSYMTYDFNFKSHAIETALNDLVESKAQINSMIYTGNGIDCQEIGIESVKNHCKELNTCSFKNRKKVLSAKSDTLYQILTSLQSKNEEHKNEIIKLRKSGIRGAVAKIKEIQEARLAMITGVLDLNPLLRGEKFKAIVDEASSDGYNQTPVPVKSQDVENALAEQLMISQKNINKKIKDFNGAYDCLIGKNDKTDKCEKFNEVLSESKYQNQDSNTFKKPALATVANFYECVENVGKSRDDADKVVNESLIGAALTFTPFAVVSGAKLAATLARVTSASSKIARVEGGVNSANVATNVAYGGYQTKEVYEQCKQAKKEFEGLGSGKLKMSCSNMDNLLINKTNDENCATQALLTAATIAPLAAPSVFRLATAVNKPKSIVSELTDKIRSGKSLTKEEEKLLLMKIEEARPIEKLLVKGISPDDAKFAEAALKKLYKQESLTPEELIKLSKLVKPSNPPLLVITQQSNISSILESNRIWGSTEGSVYASTKPIVTAVDKFKTGHMGNSEGTFIFTPEAAGLFKPHELEGLYSGLKRVAGQHKGPFGDIIIEAYEKKILDGKPFIIITKARKADTSAGEALFDGKRTFLKSETLGRGDLRKLGRRAFIEPIAAASTTAVGLQVWSWTTGKGIGQFADEYLPTEDK